MFKCTFCEKEFPYKSDFTNHKKTEHANIKQIKCDKCDKTFNNKAFLILHERSAHTKVKLKNFKSTKL